MSKSRVMRTVNLNALKIALDRAAPDAIEVKYPHFRQPGNFLYVAKRRSGKTTALVSLLRSCQDDDLMDRCLVISPTIDSHVNKNLWAGLVDEDDCYEEMSFASFNEIIDKIKEEGKEWRVYAYKKKLWDELQSYLRKPNIEPDDIPDELLLAADEHNLFEGPPDYKYKSKDGTPHHPRIHVCLDDTQSSPLLSPTYRNPVMNAAIRQRHIGGIGINLHICCQSYTSQAGLPRPIRENAAVFCIWRPADMKRRNQLAEELGDVLDRKLFLSVLDYATKDDPEHDFLTIDFNSPEGKRFRKNFDTQIELDKVAGESK